MPAISDYFIINIGDMLEILTNKRLKSPVYQVKNEKYSMAFFYELSLDTIIKPTIQTDK